MKTRLRNYAELCLIGIIMTGLCWGCAGVGQKFDDWQSSVRESLTFNQSQNESTGGKAVDQEYFIHKSRWSWETLVYVADWYTGDPQNSDKLAKINPNAHIKRLAVGSDVAIPVSMLRTREPLPQNYSEVYQRDYYTHKVRWPGESLSLISSWYTGSSQNWRKLAKVNPRLKPNRIKRGDLVKIPPALLKTHVPLPQKVAAKYTSQYFAYKVKKDHEKLENIARWYTGSASNRKRLAQANPDLDPDHLKKGNEVYIPQKLLISNRENDKSAPAASSAKPAGASSAPEPKTALVKDEKLKLFGPKQFPKE